MAHADIIMSEMEVYGSDHVHIGGVDAVDGDRIMLNMAATSAEPEAAHGHYVRIGDVARVEGNRIHLATPSSQVLAGGAMADEHVETLQPPADLKPR